MTEEEAATSTEAPQTDGQAIAESIPAAVETEPQDTKPNNNGYAPRVDLSGIPEDMRKPLEDRFAYVSGLIKKTENRYESKIRERDSILEQQSKIIEELQSGMGQVVDHLHTKSIADEENNIRALLRQAHQTGDEEGFITANERLAEIKARKIAMQAKAKEKPTQKQEQRFARSASEIADEAVADGDMDGNDKVVISVYQNERDESGQMVRPWAHSRTPNPQDDPQYMRALNYANAIWSDDRFMTTQDRLAELDRVMGTAKRQASQSVMGGGQLTNTRKSEKISLTPRQQDLAIKLKFGGSKAKSDADHLEAYRQQILKVNAKKGAR